MGEKRVRTADVVELELSDVRRDFLVGQHQPEHGDGAGQREVVRLAGVGHHEVAIIIEGIGHFVVGESDLRPQT